MRVQFDYWLLTFNVEISMEQFVVRRIYYNYRRHIYQSFWDFSSCISGVGMFAIGITDQVDETFLAALSGGAGITNGQQKMGMDYFYSPDFQTLNQIFQNMSSEVCRQQPPATRTSKDPSIVFICALIILHRIV